MTEPLLSVRNLTTSFSTDSGRLPAVDDVSFDVQPGRTLAVVGESGCGKSVTALSIMRLVESPPGEIETNLVPVRVDHAELDAPALSARLQAEGVLVMPLAPDTLRFVTHLDVGPADLERLVAALGRILG